MDLDQCLPAVRLLLMAADADMLMGQSTSPEMSALKQHLQPVASTLCSMGTHAYLATVKVERALAYWLVLMVECVGDAKAGLYMMNCMVTYLCDTS